MENYDALKNCYASHQPKSSVELGYMCHRKLIGPPAVTLNNRAGYCGPKYVLRYIAISKKVLQYIAIFINLISFC